MSTEAPAGAPAASGLSTDFLNRSAPPMGGFNPAIVRLEVRRLLRNRRTMIFALIVPVVFFLAFGFNDTFDATRIGHGNYSAYVLISIALYGAVLATVSGGAMVSIERAAGWSRQIRVTPLSPLAYVITKMVSSLVLAAGSVIVVNVVAVISQKPSMPVQDWVICALLVWIGSLVFAALGVFIGYLLPAENVMQIIGILLALLSFLGGLLIPLSQLSPGVRTVAKFTPLFGLNQLVHVPLVGGGIQLSWVLNLVVWFAIFVGGATWRLRLDTARV